MVHAPRCSKSRVTEEVGMVIRIIGTEAAMSTKCLGCGAAVPRKTSEEGGTCRKCGRAIPRRAARTSRRIPEAQRPPAKPRSLTHVIVGSVEREGSAYRIRTLRPLKRYMLALA